MSQGDEVLGPDAIALGALVESLLRDEPLLSEVIQEWEIGRRGDGALGLRVEFAKDAPCMTANGKIEVWWTEGGSVELTPREQIISCIGWLAGIAAEHHASAPLLKRARPSARVADAGDDGEPTIGRRADGDPFTEIIRVGGETPKTITIFGACAQRALNAITDAGIFGILGSFGDISPTLGADVTDVILHQPQGGWAPWPLDHGTPTQS